MKILPLLTVSALLALAFAPPADDENSYTMQDGKKCAASGIPGSSAKIKALDLLKNRNTAPKEQDIDPLVSLPAMTALGADYTRFDANKGATVQGYVMSVKVGGNESCNCKATDPTDRDTHIALSMAPGAPEKQWVIVEVTPRLRLQKKGQADWSTKALEDQETGILNKWVEVSGWLLFDLAHVNEAENTKPGRKGNWRATCWEIHPVTSIKVLDGPPEELKDFKPESFAALQSAHAKHLESTKGLAELDKRNLALHEGLTDEEKKDIEEEAKERRPTK
jgi:hypothetical protein